MLYFGRCGGANTKTTALRDFEGKSAREQLRLEEEERRARVSRERRAKLAEEEEIRRAREAVQRSIERKQAATIAHAHQSSIDIYARSWLVDVHSSLVKLNESLPKKTSKGIRQQLANLVKLAAIRSFQPSLTHVVAFVRSALAKLYKSIPKSTPKYLRDEINQLRLK